MKNIATIVLVFVSFNLYAQQKNISGKYRFEEQRIDGESGWISHWEIELKPDSTFRIVLDNNYIDVSNNAHSYGVYRIDSGVVHLYSKIPKDLNILKEVRSKILPDSLFKISIELRGSEEEIDTRKFFSLNKNYERKRVAPLYVIRKDTTKLEYGSNNSVSFVFRKSALENFLLCSLDAINSRPPSGFLIDLHDFQYNNYFLSQWSDALSRNQYDRTDFVDVSSYRFTIGNRSLTTADIFAAPLKAKRIKLKKLK